MHYGTPRHSGRYAWGSGDNPYHHGQSAPWGVRRKIRKYDKLKKTLDKNHGEQDKVNKSLNSYFKSRATIKSAENREKAAKLQKRVDRANRKLSKGKDLSWRQRRALEKYEKYNTKADKYDSKTVKQRAELNTLEAREQRIIAKMNKIDDKLLSKHISLVRIRENEINRGKRKIELLEQTIKKQKTKSKQVDYLKREIDRTKSAIKILEENPYKKYLMESGRYEWGTGRTPRKNNDKRKSK